MAPSCRAWDHPVHWVAPLGSRAVVNVVFAIERLSLLPLSLVQEGKLWRGATREIFSKPTNRSRVDTFGFGRGRGLLHKFDLCGRHTGGR